MPNRIFYPLASVPYAVLCRWAKTIFIKASGQYVGCGDTKILNSTRIAIVNKMVTKIGN